MASVEEIRAARLLKLNSLKAKGINPYPVSASPEYTLAETIAKFTAFSKRKKPLTLAGRVMSLRPHGALIFFNFFDGTATFQGFLKKEDMAAAEFELFAATVDIADFIEVSGTLFLTKRNEKTLNVSHWRMLAKALRQLPEKWHGLQDVEERFRHRYLDTLMSPVVRERFMMRSKMISLIREFYDTHGYIEVETPRLQTVAGGATALPFMTHHNALDTDFFLTVAQELYLKELLVGGFTKVYEIGRKFRNEGIDVTHNPEFTMLESQEAYADATGQRAFIEKLLNFLVEGLFSKKEFTHGGYTIHVAKKFTVITFFELLIQHAKIPDPQSLSRDELILHAKRVGVPVAQNDSSEKIMDSIYKKACRPKLIQPTFIVDYPSASNPFAKRKEDNPTLIDRFQLVAGGLEIVNAFSELNDPIDQKERYLLEDEKKKKGESDISPSDKEYLEAMEYGMPPNGGIGIGIDRLAMLLTDTHNIREVILFPTLRPKK